MQQRFQDKPPEIYKRRFAALSFPLAQLLFVILQVLQRKGIYFAFCHMFSSLAYLLIEILLWPVSISVQVWHGPRKRKYTLERKKQTNKVWLSNNTFHASILSSFKYYFKQSLLLFSCVLPKKLLLSLLKVTISISDKMSWKIFHKLFLEKH